MNIHAAVVLIIAASSRIGAATVRAASRAGARLVLAVSRRQRVAQLAEQLGDAVAGLVAGRHAHIRLNLDVG